MADDKSDFEKANEAAALAASVLPSFLAVMDKLADLIVRLHAPKADAGK